MTDITALAQRMKAAALKADGEQWQTRDGFSGIEVIVKGSLAKGRGCVSYQPVAADLADSKTAKAIALFSPANVLTLVEALEKAQQSVELVDLQRDKIKQLESDLWDKDQLRKVHSEKSFELEGKVRELEARNQKDFVWRGKEISRLNDEVDELKEKLESRTVTVKLPAEYLNADGSVNADMANTCPVVSAYREAHRAAGIQVIEGEQKNG